MRGLHKGRTRQLFDNGLRQRCLAPVNAKQITMDRESGRLELIPQAFELAIRLLCHNQARHPAFRTVNLLWLFCLQFAPRRCHSIQLQRLQTRRVINGHWLLPADCHNAGNRQVVQLSAKSHQARCLLRQASAAQ